MPSSLSNTLDTGLMSLTVITRDQHRPTLDQLSVLDDLIVDRFGWAFRFGLGASSSLNDYRFGYFVPGVTLNPSTIKTIEQRLQQETTLSDPTVQMKAITNITNDDLYQMDLLGRMPSEAISSLDQLKEDVRAHT
jgi:hypothetical protein